MRTPAFVCTRSFAVPATCTVQVDDTSRCTGAIVRVAVVVATDPEDGFAVMALLAACAEHVSGMEADLQDEETIQQILQRTMLQEWDGGGDANAH